ncbi:MAG: hypothetical protein ACTHL8_21760 [Burkholderiaceae bacterium]
MHAEHAFDGDRTGSHAAALPTAAPGRAVRADVPARQRALAERLIVADPGLRDVDGLSAADLAEHRSHPELAALLRAWLGPAR